MVLLLTRDEQSKFEDLFQGISEYIFLVIYTVELVLLILSYGYRDFFDDGWRILCLIIVILSYLNLIVDSDLVKSNIFVSIRLIRMFRLLKFAKGIRALIQVATSKYKQLINIFIVSI